MSRTRSRVIFIAPTFCQWITFSYVQNAIHASVRMSDPVVALGQLGRNAVRRRADGGCRLVWRGRWQHLPAVRTRPPPRRRAAAHHRARAVGDPGTETAPPPVALLLWRHGKRA